MMRGRMLLLTLYIEVGTGGSKRFIRSSNDSLMWSFCSHIQQQNKVRERDGFWYKQPLHTHLTVPVLITAFENCPDILKVKCIRICLEWGIFYPDLTVLSGFCQVNLLL